MDERRKENPKRKVELWAFDEHRVGLKPIHGGHGRRQGWRVLRHWQVVHPQECSLGGVRQRQQHRIALDQQQITQRADTERFEQRPPVRCKVVYNTKSG